MKLLLASCLVLRVSASCFLHSLHTLQYADLVLHLQDCLSPMAMIMHSNLAYLNTLAVEALPHWWQKIDNDPQWQEYSFVGLSAAYGLIALVALVQLVRIGS